VNYKRILKILAGITAILIIGIRVLAKEDKK
jgi:hypothetical protein